MLWFCKPTGNRIILMFHGCIDAYCCITLCVHVLQRVGGPGEPRLVATLGLEPGLIPNKPLLWYGVLVFLSAISTVGPSFVMNVFQTMIPKILLQSLCHVWCEWPQNAWSGIKRPSTCTFPPHCIAHKEHPFQGVYMVRSCIWKFVHSWLQVAIGLCLFQLPAAEAHYEQTSRERDNSREHTLLFSLLLPLQPQ